MYALVAEKARRYRCFNSMYVSAVQDDIPRQYLSAPSVRCPCPFGDEDLLDVADDGTHPLSRRVNTVHAVLCGHHTTAPADTTVVSIRYTPYYTDTILQYLQTQPSYQYGTRAPYYSTCRHNGVQCANYTPLFALALSY